MCAREKRAGRVGAMPGPVPKAAATRQRRNTTATTATLKAAEARLPARLPKEREWHPLTARWWRELRRSPMAAEYVQFDVEGLLRLAAVVDLANWCPGDLKIEETIARLGALYGLTPIDRRRLDWRIERKSAVTAPRDGRPPAPSGADPRSVLRAVQ